VGLFAFGLLLILVGKMQLDAGQWIFLNATHRQTTFAAGAYGVGALFRLLAFLPPDNWMYRHTTRRSPMRDTCGHGLGGGSASVIRRAPMI
jgi:hypothetical protein